MSKYVVTWPCGTQWQCDTLTEAKRMDALGKAQGKKRNPGGAKQRARGTRLADVSVYGGDPGEKFEHPDTKHLSGWYSPNDRYARLIKMAEKARASRGRALKSGEPGMNMSLHAHRAALAEARRLREFVLVPPTCAQARAGIQDAAIETADVVLMTDSPLKMVEAVNNAGGNTMIKMKLAEALKGKKIYLLPYGFQLFL